VTWPAPELLDGAVDPCRPPFDEAVPELDDVLAPDPLAAAVVR
jgi:hypothetical protein